MKGLENWRERETEGVSELKEDGRHKFKQKKKKSEREESRVGKRIKKKDRREGDDWRRG